MNLGIAFAALAANATMQAAADDPVGSHFTTLDWAIVAVYLVGSIAVGVYANRFISKLSDYLVAGRGLGIYLAVATMTGTELGLVTVMYNAEEGFRSGFSAFTVGLIAFATSLVIGLTGFIIMRLRQEGVMTIPEYYERRFGPKVRWAGGVVLSVACVLNFALFLKVGATYVTIVTGLEKPSVRLTDAGLAEVGRTGAVPVGVRNKLVALKGQEFANKGQFRDALGQALSRDETARYGKDITAKTEVKKGTMLKVVMAVMLVLVLLYTALGGMVSVVITDYLQFVVLTVSMVIATWFAFTKVGWFEVTDATVDALRADKVDAAVLDKLDGLKGKRFGEKTAFAAELTSALTQDQVRSCRQAGLARSARTRGWDAMVTTVKEHMGDGGFDPVKAGRYGWTFIFWMAFLNLSAQICWLPSTIRALSAKDPTVAKRLYTWSGLSFLIRCIVPMLWGIAAFTMIKATPSLDALFFPAEGEPTMQALEAMPTLFARILPVGLLGLVTAGMMAAFMSTHDSYLLAFSSVITQDVVSPALKFMGKPGLSDRQRIWLTRVLIIAMGIFVLCWGLLYEPPESIWKYMAATGTIYLPGAFACLLAGIYWKRASTVGAGLAIGFGLFGLAGIVDWPGMGLDFLTQDNIAVMTILFCLTGMVAGSLMFPDGKERSGHEVLYAGSVVALFIGIEIVAAAAVASGLSPAFWRTVLTVGGALFFVMAGLIAVLGFGDMRDMLSLLGREADAAKPDDENAADVDE